MERSQVDTHLVSIIIAVKNSAAYLASCLESVAAQTFTDYEIVVVDGRSTDATEAIARSYARVRFFQQIGNGFADAWNCGLREARGEYIAFIDSDDWWTPNKLAGQFAMLQSDPSLEGVIGKVRFFLEPGELPPRGFRAKVLDRDHVAHMPGVLMARRRLFEHIGDWGEGWVVANDIDWFLKLKDSRLPIGILDEVVLHKRVHSRNFSYATAENPVYPQEVLRLLRDSILRKRANKVASGG
jgi:glycosyltransferase involved in cell wall biosynthesis